MAACGGDDKADAGNKAPSSSSAASEAGEKKPAGQGETDADTSKVLATVKGAMGIDMVIHTAQRDQGGFLTLTGELKNTSGSRVVTPVEWSGKEEAVVATGPSLAAMTLVDSQAKKRYYVLRDTNDRPLTTTNYDSGIDAGASLPFFAQFPAPAPTTSEVSVQFPGFSSATIEISG
ncbi:hypothetical protein [Streptomyces drozdowiczii]|uniref:Secreted protein n=1 Tax=Streptomyces drozdowiczii TaxID=202862 RepID=A0ABY6PR19_9ACTN|nr:hypothetical protein [Streptomyces drozdowiczii]MCX0245743.1 hypothetical protein [Streptomyces drozdowiczii]UZK54653.1 hypothetical protein NEH16_11345 [Streptomyces drozdowiczii]